MSLTKMTCGTSTTTDLIGNVNGLIDFAPIALSSSELDAGVNYSKLSEAITTFDAVVVSGGVVYVNDTVIVPSGKSLITEHGTVLKMASGSNKMVICNEGLKRSFSSANVNWLSADGRKFTVDWVGHGLSVGDAYCIQGSNSPVFNTVFRVADGTTENSIVSYCNKLPSVTPSGAVSVKSLDKDIFINVKADYNKAGGNNGVDMETMCSIFAYVCDSELLVNGVDANKYIGQISAAMNVDITIGGASNSDIMKFYGALRDIRGRVYGTSHDDCFSVQAKEPAAYIRYQPAVGPISNVTVSNFSVEQTLNTQNHSGGMVVYSDDTYNIAGIVFENGSVSDSQACCFMTRYGDGFSSTEPLIDDITIRNVNMQAALNRQTIIVRGKVRSLVIDTPKISPSNATQALIIAESTSSIGHLSIDGWKYNASQNSSYLVTMQGVATNVIFNGCDIKGSSGNQTRLINVLPDKAEKVAFNDCNIQYIGRVLNYEPSATKKLQVVQSGCNIKFCDGNIYGSSQLDAILQGSTYESVTNGALRANASGATVRLFDFGSTYTSTSAMTSVSSGVTVPMSMTVPANLTSVGMVKTVAGSMAYSTLAVGTIPANRVVVCDGANWKDITNTSNTY